MPDTGKLSISLTSTIGNVPIDDATVSISYTGVPDSTIAEIKTDSSGKTEAIDVTTPPLEYSITPQDEMPYTECTITIRAPGYQQLVISGTEVLPNALAIQPGRMIPEEAPIRAEDIITIPDHTLYGEYPPKIPEDEVKSVAETGEIVLSQVVIPEFVIVHDGVPDDTTAPNYYIRYKDYIKNVVSSEIYATWTESAIYANTLAILSFTLNRVYTEWYRNKGYNFTVTSSTAFDQKWIYGRNIYQNVDYVVDGIFSNFLSRPGIRQPILTQYCDGRRVTCPHGMSQWGSQYLGDQGYAPIEIIHYYYGSDMFINTTDQVAGVPSSWPGYNLTIGSSGDKVRQLQEQLNRIARNYPLIPSIAVDGIYGQNTANAVRTFQSIFGLPPNGITDYPTWYKISDIYVAVTRIAEPGI